MSVHQFDKNMRPDSDFIHGNISLLIKGNKCRLLDGRRTTGYIEEYFDDSAMFRWRITKYEDEGKYWDLPAEEIKRFQFEKDSKTLGDKKIEEIHENIKRYNKTIYIEAQKYNRIQSQKKIFETQQYIEKWMVENSIFLKEKEQLNLSSRVGSELLSRDLMNYMEHIGMVQEEIKTAEAFVLNPSSGEWIKGMKIALADMGLVPYKGKATRTNEIFRGLGSKTNRQRYLINRLAFVRAYFNLLGIKDVVLYRGMSNENQWKEVTRSFLSCTFSLKVARSFSVFSKDSKYKSAYLIKLTCPVDQLFMTYIETEQMNKQYKEAEALILYDKELRL